MRCSPRKVAGPRPARRGKWRAASPGAVALMPTSALRETAARPGWFSRAAAIYKPLPKILLRHRRVVVQFLLAEPDANLLISLLRVARRVHQVGDRDAVRVGV